MSTTLTEAERERFCHTKIAMAHHLANKYARINFRDENRVRDVLDDLVSAALLGLARAALRFDPSRGVAETTYAYYAMQHCIFEELARYKSGGMSRCQSKKTKYPLPKVEHIPFDEFVPLSYEQPDHLEHDDIREFLFKRVLQLKPMERRIIVDRHYEGLTLEATARKRGISKERVRQIQVAAVARLRKELGE